MQGKGSDHDGYDDDGKYESSMSIYLVEISSLQKVIKKMLYIKNSNFACGMSCKDFSQDIFFENRIFDVMIMLIAYILYVNIGNLELITLCEFNIKYVLIH